MIKHLNELVESLNNEKTKKMAVAYAQDPNTIGAVSIAVKKGIVEAYMVGDPKKIKEVARNENIDPSIFHIVDEPDEVKAGKKAVSLVKSGECEILMKGLISTGKYMKAILNKEEGILPKGAVLSHVTVVDVPTYHKLMFLSDVAVIPLPTLDQKVKMINYTVDIAHKFGIENPKVALIAATEKANPKMPASAEAAIISKMGDRKQIKGCIIDGPLALDVAISKEACEIKGLKTEVGGDADVFIFPNIEAGNVFYKAVTRLAGGELAAVVVGTNVPVILTSRGDSEESKLFSIALAAKMA
ncbi:MAG: bifunctional enoyl-CoA hydratase/phosphate acetyltransferase [Proteobacteria bacterium]|nr:bifunctional enoyl-CoA hydratase/phosphate acetyltransferase [Pseudomonadota bacterium]